jgi:hypothetical protein
MQGRGVAYLSFIEEFYGDADGGGEFAHGGLGFEDGHQCGSVLKTKIFPSCVCGW